MNCWKTINLSRDLGNQRLIVVSMFVMLPAFIMMYVPLSIINESTHLNDDYMLLFLICLLLLIPIHLVCHAIPAWLTGQRIKVRFYFNSRFLPIFTIQYNHQLPRNIKIASILAPTVFITCPLIFCSIIYPQFMHYFSIIAAINIGLSVSDIIYLMILIKAPKKSMIEHTRNSFDILVHNK
ncbi:MAG TPA: DUF3267 domain-containing protein [Bacillus bacterium]|nr:DUF3267 domain-containing protein [Bacillus sp. (in: firmicutes)]